MTTEGHIAALERRHQELDRMIQTESQNRLVRELERRLADYLQVEHCVAMANGTAALEVTARALGLRGEVIVPAFPFIATPHAFSWLNLEPVFCDVVPRRARRSCA